MDDISTYEEETAQAKLVRNGLLIIVFLFVIVVSCLSIIDGFNGSGKEGIALMGIGLALFAITTFVLLRRIFKQDIDEAAKIPTYMQLFMLVFLGIAILIGDYSDSSGSSNSCTKLPDCLYSETCCVYDINGSIESGSISSTNGTSICTLNSIDKGNIAINFDDYDSDNDNSNMDSINSDSDNNNKEWYSRMPNQKYIENLYLSSYQSNERRRLTKAIKSLTDYDTIINNIDLNNQEKIELIQSHISNLNKQINRLKEQEQEQQ